MKDGALNVTKAANKKGISREADQPFSVGKPDHASYTPNASINPLSYGGNGGKPSALGTVPSVQMGNSFEVAALPAMPGQLSIGENKNVSTPVSG